MNGSMKHLTIKRNTGDKIDLEPFIKKKYPKLYSCKDYSNIEYIMETPGRDLELLFDPAFYGVFTDLNDKRYK